MKFRKVVNRKVDGDSGTGAVAASINAVVAANIGEAGSSYESSRQRVRVVQRNGKTEVFEESDMNDRSEEESDPGANG
jgi:hypothetical protein